MPPSAPTRTTSAATDCTSRSVAFVPVARRSFSAAALTRAVVVAACKGPPVEVSREVVVDLEMGRGVVPGAVRPRREAERGAVLRLYRVEEG